MHVFTPTGKHVTSVVMQGSAVNKRRQQNRWRPAEPQERGEFRIHLRRLRQSGEARTSEPGEVSAVAPNPWPVPTTARMPTPSDEFCSIAISPLRIPTCSIRSSQARASANSAPAAWAASSAILVSHGPSSSSPEAATSIRTAEATWIR